MGHNLEAGGWGEAMEAGEVGEAGEVMEAASGSTEPAASQDTASGKTPPSPGRFTHSHFTSLVHKGENYKRSWLTCAPAGVKPACTALDSS